MSSANLDSYIESLKGAEKRLTREEWVLWIKGEVADLMSQDERVSPLTPEEIDHVLDVLEADGYVIKEFFLLIEKTKTDEFISAFDTREEAEKEKSHKEIDLENSNLTAREKSHITYDVMSILDYDEGGREAIINDCISYDFRKTTK